jgi:hypothetical protein
MLKRALKEFEVDLAIFGFLELSDTWMRPETLMNNGFDIN